MKLREHSPRSPHSLTLSPSRKRQLLEIQMGAEQRQMMGQTVRKSSRIEEEDEVRARETLLVSHALSLTLSMSHTLSPPSRYHRSKLKERVERTLSNVRDAVEEKEKKRKLADGENVYSNGEKQS